jgi:hypothetical protein
MVIQKPVPTHFGSATPANSISRRTLLASTAALLPAKAEPAALAGVEQTASGRINLGLSGTGNDLLVYPFINIWKCGGHIQVVAGGSNYLSSIPRGVPGSEWDRYIDDNGELTRLLPGDETQMRRVFYGPQIYGLPTGYNRVGTRWILKWEGTATDVSITGAVSPNRDRNRIIWNWGSNIAEMAVTFSKMDPNDPPRNICLCEERYEGRYDTGEIFDPAWLASVREGSGIIRFMCWQIPSHDLSTLRFSDFPSEKYCSYGGLNTKPFNGTTMKPFIKGGVPLSLISRLANETQSHPWVCIPNVLGTNKLSSIASITNTNPAMVTSPGHNWDDGDRVIVFGTNWPQIESSSYTVIDADKRAGTFALESVDSRSFTTFDSKWASATAPYDLDSIERELVPFAAHFRDHVARGLITYFELGNENWNGSFIAHHWLNGQARWKFGHKDSELMSGYLAAHCMRVIRDTYRLDGRNSWRGVLATQTVSVEATARLIEGVRKYLAEHEPSLHLTDLFGDLAVTGYFGRKLGFAQKATVMGWMELSEEHWHNGREPTKYSFFNRIVNEDLADARYTNFAYSVDKLKEFWRAQKEIADANGLGLIQYEGGNANVPGFFGSLTPSEQAHFMEFYRHCCHTTEDARNYTAMFEAFLAIGGKYPAKFVEAGDVTRYGNWGALRYPGDSNPVWEAVVAFNARA